MHPGSCEATNTQHTGNHASRRVEIDRCGRGSGRTVDARSGEPHASDSSQSQSA